MAKIVKSETGYWVGKDLYPNSLYYPSKEVYFEHPATIFVAVDVETLKSDIEQAFGISLSQRTRKEFIAKIATELCNAEYGMLYCFDLRSKFGVRKIIDPPVKEPEKKVQSNH